MKDYSNNELERQEFIKKYKIKKDKIIIYYANGEKFEIIYTPENEEKILKKMNKQAYNTKEKEKSLKVNKIVYNGVLLGSAILASIASLFAFSGPEISALFGKIVLALGISGMAISSYKVIKDTIVARDINKTKFFIDNKETLNKEITNESVLKNNISKKTVKKVSKNLNKDTTININDIDKMSYNDLIQLRNNIEHYLALNLEDREISKKTSKILTRK